MTVTHVPRGGPQALGLDPHFAFGKNQVYPAGPQAGINHLLIDEARAGQTVVRLTDGDPFLFERGGEEAEALVEAGIAFEVVPGGARAASAVAPEPPSGRSGADRNAHTASGAQPGPYRSCRFGHEPDLALSLRGGAGASRRLGLRHRCW